MRDELSAISGRDGSVTPSRTAYPRGSDGLTKINEASGSYLICDTGRKIFDAAGGSGSLIFGHGDREIADVLKQQAQSLSVFPGKYFGVDRVEEFASNLLEFAPPGFASSLFMSSGSDAVEAALKLAIQYNVICDRPTKTKIIGREGSYHGNTLSGLSVGGFLRRRQPFESVLRQVRKGEIAHCASCHFKRTPSDCALECLGSIEFAIQIEGPDSVAAVIVEPVVGAALSAAEPDPRYLQGLRALCDRYGVLLIFDEVMTGFGRLGTPFAAQHWNVIPDILVCGKAISAGYYPLSALLVSKAITDALGSESGPFQNGHTHACSPLAAAVGLNVLERIKRDGLVSNAASRGRQLREALQSMATEGVIANIRGEGLMIGFDVRPPGLAQTYAGSAELFAACALDSDLLVYPSTGWANSLLGEHVMLLPPLNISEADVVRITDSLSAAAQRMARGRT